jgi:hypothetical protein
MDPTYNINESESQPMYDVCLYWMESDLFKIALMDSTAYADHIHAFG